MKTVKFDLPNDVIPDKIKAMPVCGVIATAIVSGNPFSDVWKYYKVVSEEKSFRGGLLRSKIKQGIQEFGVAYKEIKDLPNSKLRRFKQVATHLDLIDPSLAYIIFTTKHVQLLWNGWVIDQGGRKRIKDYHHRNKKVDEVYMIENIKFEL